MLPFYTVGHSTLTVDEFIQLLSAADITLVVDIRSFPRSRTNTQYNEDVLPLTLAKHHIGYLHLAELGGRRSRIKAISNETNGFWKNRSFQNYADYAMTPDFQDGLEKLIKLGRKECCVLMCSEAVWWRCHRRIVADHLIARGKSVFHLMNTDKIEPASLTKGAIVQDAKLVTYPYEEVKISKGTT
ncbi:MAG: DUF488 domain-containing protein [Methylophaga sp.]|uniref:DUF488 domain-containing protein n=1 Tax=Methylophaga sp. TaxID=2024840 RepID=UPI000C1074EE|nr:DUF488 domain-containing protein [Methylophaga sp.]MBL1458159.1 DUF488 domain-containing protein [Methylophaga sp.]